MTPLRVRCAARAGEGTDAVVRRDARARLDDEVLQVGPRQVEVQLTERTDLKTGVAGVDVDTRRLHRTDVDVGVDDVTGTEPELTERVTTDARAGRSVVVGVARLERVLCTEARDVLLDTDVEPVDRHHETRGELRLEDHAHRVGVGLFRLEVRVSALQELVLTGRAVEGCRSHVRSGDTRRDTLGRGGRPGVSAARIAVDVEQVEALRGEQLDDVRRTDGGLVAATDLEGSHRRPVETDLVGVGVDVAVIRVAVGEVGDEVVSEGRALHEGHARLGEQVGDLGRAGDADRCTAGARERRGGEQRIGLTLELVTTVLGAEGDPHGLIGGRELEARVARDGGEGHILVDAADGDARRLQVVEGRLRHATRLEGVVGHAAVGAGAGVTAADRAVRQTDRIQGLVDTVDDEVVEGLFVRLDR